MSSPKIFIAILTTILLLNPTHAADWLQQGGPNRDAVVPPETAGKLTESFPDQKIPLLWKTNVGMGSAPVVVSGGRIYTFGLYKPGADPSKLADITSCPPPLQQDKKTDKTISLQDIPGTPDWVKISGYGTHPDCIYKGDEYAQCLDAATGKILWTTRLTDFGIAYKNNQPCGALASPAIADDKIVFHSPDGHLYCLNLNDGKKLWEVNLWEHEMSTWACKNVNASGPLIINGTVIVSYCGVSDAVYKRLLNGEKPFDLSDSLLILGCFDLQSGKRKWLCKPDKHGFRLMQCRIGYAVIENNPTVLVPFGAGTYGVDPATGTKRWEYDVPDDKGTVIDGEVSGGIWAPYGSYAPVAWGNYVIDDMSNAHDDLDSHTWCLQITDNKPKVVWETNQFVPYTECEKSNLLIRNEKVYGFDAHGVWDGQRAEMKKSGKFMHPGRAKRSADVGQFQCRDVKTGKLLWSSDAMIEVLAPNDWRAKSGATTAEWYSTKSILCEDILIAFSGSGLWIVRLKDNGLEVLAKGPKGAQVSEPVLVDGLLYVREFDSSKEGNLSCYDLRPQSGKDKAANK